MLQQAGQIRNVELAGTVKRRIKRFLVIDLLQKIPLTILKISGNGKEVLFAVFPRKNGGAEFMVDAGFLDAGKGFFAVSLLSAFSVFWASAINLFKN